MLHVPPNTTNQLKDHLGRYRTYSLFIERPSPDMQPLWSWRDEDQVVNDILYPSLKKIYFSYDHVPGFEYEFAMACFNSWDHWIKLTTSGLRGIFSEWRNELEIRNKAEAIRMLFKTSKEPNAAGANAAKYIAENGFASKRGRPSKDEVEREKKIAAGIDKALEDDVERMGLKLVGKTK